MNNQVIVVDDHPALRMAIRFLLKEEGFDIVAEADNGIDALQLVEDLRPPLLILDLNIPGIDGFTVIERIVDQKLAVKIIVLSAETSSHIVTKCRRSGAHGYMSKRDSSADLFKAIATVRSNGTYFPAPSW